MPMDRAFADDPHREQIIIRAGENQLVAGHLRTELTPPRVPELALRRVAWTNEDLWRNELIRELQDRAWETPLVIKGIGFDRQSNLL